MWNKFAVWLTNHALKKADLSIEQRNKIVIHILISVQALPIYDIISTNDDGTMLINGVPLDVEKAKQLRESAKAALNNVSLKVINQQTLFTAVALGVHTVESEKQMLFSRAAIWFGQQQEKHLKTLAGMDSQQLTL